MAEPPGDSAGEASAIAGDDLKHLKHISRPYISIRKLTYYDSV